MLKRPPVVSFISRGFVVLGAALLFAGCITETHDPRSVWLASTLYRDHQALIARGPERVAAKYALMGSTAWRYYRATAPQMFRDLAEVGSPLRSPFLFQSVETSRLWLVGDPHLENIGTALLDSGDLTLSFNDFDGARPGPYYVDLLRLGASLALLCEPSVLDDGFDAPPGCETLPAVMAASYADAIGRLARGEELRALRWSDPAARGGVIAEDLLRRAARDRDAQAVFATWVDDAGQLARGPLEEPSVAGVRPEGGVALDARIFDALRTRLAARCLDLVLARPAASSWDAWAAEGALFAGAAGGPCTVIDMVRREGLGVASHALERYVALVAVRPAGAAVTYHLLDLKEAWDPPFFTELNVLPPRLAADNAARIVAARARALPPGAADPFNAGLSLGAMDLRVSSLLAAEKGFSVTRIRAKVGEGDFRVQELAALSRTLGRLLAETHARSRFVDRDTAPSVAIDALTAPAGPAFADAVAAASRELATRVLSDYALFVRMRGASTDPVRPEPVWPDDAPPNLDR